MLKKYYKISYYVVVYIKTAIDSYNIFAAAHNININNNKHYIKKKNVAYCLIFFALYEKTLKHMFLKL